MSKQISGLRVARSFVTPTGAETIVRELDFQLGANQGIAIQAVLGYGGAIDANPAPSDTEWALTVCHQSLHLETGTTELLPIGAGDDEDDIDTEAFYIQSYYGAQQTWSTATGGAGGLLVATPSGLVTFAEPIQTARNISHVGRTITAGQSGNVGVFIYYHYVLFSGSELGFLLARRQ